MGGKRRKSAKRVSTKRKAVVPKTFKCVYCNHDGSCEVKIDRESETGAITCRVCGESFQCRITYLSDPVDVYCEWVDSLEGARAGGAAGAMGREDARAAAEAMRAGGGEDGESS